ncbi:hypothetical protein MMC07_000333 [Pseudocyphellaria aurata]|nr:hypothetical protein [Pseudocyphellaria aurata]
MASSTIDNFLEEVRRLLHEKDGVKLQDVMLLEPPLPPSYHLLVGELRASFPEGSEDALLAKCASFLPEFDADDDDRDGGGSSPAFASFAVKYFAFLRDVDVDDLVETHDMLKNLLNQAILALSSSMGLVILPTVISFSRTLARLAIGLDKRPELIAHLVRRESFFGSEEAAERVTLVEASANVIREAFKKCLSERSGPQSGIDSNGKPAGRRVGIYITANICLKLFFHCRKLRSAEQIFGNIYQQSPPLSLFPASQRVTYLYYLGRYLFANSHFFRAQLALQEAYDQCHPDCLRQRRLILIYLITSNIILGSFPAPELLRRQEAIGLSEKFLPLCSTIAKGDITSFRRLLDLKSENADWFLRKRILLQISNRCEILVWRSLARRTFLLSGSQGDTTNKKAATLDLKDLLALGIYLESKVLSPNSAENAPKPRLHTNSVFLNPTSPSPLEISGYTDPDFQKLGLPDAPPDLPTMPVIESLVASLVQQDLLHGYISHGAQRFAITGAKLTVTALEAGFPAVWETLTEKADHEVPGWVKNGKGIDGETLPTQARVIKLTGARPAGAPPE